ncbi:MAG: hypothetical protein K8I00_13280 [Candidatus Omnitrophica bacterium]|nr:hypothetical protein [Candidatus Omnitrophota bacterium]
MGRRALRWLCMLLLLCGAGIYFYGTLPRATLDPAGQSVSAKPSGNNNARRDCESRREGPDLLVNCRYYYDTGTLRGESSYKNGLPHGNFKVYFYNGQLRQEHAYVDGRRYGAYKRYFPEGGLAQQYAYVNGTSRKIAEYFFPGGQKMGREELENNRYHGRAVFFNEKSEIISDLIARDNTFYQQDGRLAEGKRRFNYANGRPLYVDNFVRGRLTGIRSLYREDSALIWQYHFRDGLAEGRVSEHYQNGSVRAYKYYRNHKLYKEEEFDPQGNLIFSGEYGEPEPIAVKNISEIRAGQFGR